MHQAILGGLMPLSSEISKNFDHAFICAESHIEGICNILRKRIAPTIEISATLNDGTTRRFVDEVELFKFNNPRSCRIQRLSLTSRDRGETIQGHPSNLTKIPWVGELQLAAKPRTKR
jgi:hypothetical protein